MRRTALEQKLRLRFRNQHLLQQALVHPSYLNELPPDERPVGSYERLEFLGDAVLGAAITLELFRRYPDLPEGQLTKLRASLVSGRNLANVARSLDLGQHLRLGKGEEATGGRERGSNLAAGFEALAGAVFLDRGFDRAGKFVLDMMRDKMEAILAEGVPQDPKSHLQEVLQAAGREPPQYRLVEAGGPDHARNFDVEVVLDGQVIGRGQGRRKLEAEKLAAQEALGHLRTTADH